MVEESQLNLLVSNILNGNRYSHCRICLELISESYVRFKDLVSLDDSNQTFTEVTEMISSILGADICEEIAGIDAICKECVDQILNIFRFKEKCNNSTQLLHNLFDNLSNTFTSMHPDTLDCDSNLYVSVNENEAQLIFVGKEVAENKTAVNKNLQCSTCFEEFSDEFDLKMHYLTIHKEYLCTKCNETVKDLNELAKHNNGAYQCPDCEELRCTKKGLQKHQEVHKSHVCQNCGKYFSTVSKLQMHEQKHIDKCECPKCGKTYFTQQFFLNHVKLCLKDKLDPHPQRSKIKKTHICQECGKGYSTYGGLRVHNRFVHGTAKPHVCELCNKQFTAPSYLKVHMVTHTQEKNYKCNICTKKFVTKEALLYHTRRHTGEKPYSCTMCDEKFVNGSARAEHIKFKHKSPTFMCELCSRKFYTRNTLRLHMEKHEDPANKLYIHRSHIPANVPAVENMRVKLGQVK